MATGRSKRRVEAESRPEFAVFRGTLGVVVENQVRARMVGLSRFIHECEPDLLWPEKYSCATDSCRRQHPVPYLRDSRWKGNCSRADQPQGFPERLARAARPES